MAIEIIEEGNQAIKDRIANEAKNKLKAILQSHGDKQKHQAKKFAAGKSRKGMHAMMAQAKNQNKASAARSEKIEEEKLAAQLERQRVAAQAKAAAKAAPVAAQAKPAAPAPAAQAKKAA